MKTPLLWLLAILLASVNVVLAMVEGADRLTGSVLIGSVVGQVVLFPLIVVAIAAIWKKNRTMARALKVFCWVSVVGFGTLALQVARVHSEPPKDIAGRFGNVQITVPSTWVMNPSMGQAEAIHVMSKSKMETFAVVPDERSGGADSVQQVAQRGTDRFANGAEVNAMRGPVPCVVDSLPCTQYEMDMDINGSDVTMAYSVVEGKKRFYHMMATTSTNRYQRNKPRFDKVLGSFKELR